MHCKRKRFSESIASLHLVLAQKSKSSFQEVIEKARFHIQIIVRRESFFLFSELKPL